MKKFFSDLKGTSTVEFVLTVFWYFAIVCLVIEFSRISLASGYLDLVTAESVRLTKNEVASDEGGVEHNYEARFKKVFNERQALLEDSPVGMFALKGTASNISVQYADTVEDLVNGNFRIPKRDSAGNVIPPSGKKAAIAVYNLSYNFNYIVAMPFLPSIVKQHILTRRILVIQEYER